VGLGGFIPPGVGLGGVYTSQVGYSREVYTSQVGYSREVYNSQVGIPGLYP